MAMSSRSTTSISRSARTSSSPCSGRPAPARPPDRALAPHGRLARGGVDGPRGRQLADVSFDEIIVTTFTIGSEQTLPIWIFTNYARPNQFPIVNVVGLCVIVLSIIPVYLANRLSQDPVGSAAGAPTTTEPAGARG
jgi:hypothetical protein